MILWIRAQNYQMSHIQSKVNYLVKNNAHEKKSNKTAQNRVKNNAHEKKIKQNNTE